MNAPYYAAIMAGGGGTRLWPLSRSDCPKQVLELFGGVSLFQMSVGRLGPLFPPEKIIVLCPPGLESLLKGQAPQLPRDNYFLEPEPRGNAAAIGLAALRLRKRDPESVMACLTADHVIQDVNRFQALLLSAYEAACDGNLVTLGIDPVSSDPSYGYIERGSPAGLFAGLESFYVSAFTEKPGPELAEAYVNSGKYAWNSGMFVWSVGTVLGEMERQMPGLYSGLMEIDAALDTDDEQSVIERVWSGLETTSIDYGIMEGAERIVMFAAQDIGWDDVGDWSRLQRLSGPDQDGNVIQAESTFLSDAHGVFVLYEPKNREEKLLVVHGVENLILVDTGDVLLLCSRDQAGEVKEIVEKLKRSGLDRYL